MATWLIVLLSVMGYAVIGVCVSRVCLHFDPDLDDDVLPGFIVLMWPAVVSTVLFVLGLCGLGRLAGKHPEPPWGP